MLHVLSAKQSRASSLSLVFTLLAFGCGAVPGGEGVELETSSIVNGERSVPADDDVVQVIAHPAGSAPQACTGTLVAPNIVLTALHCVAQFTSGNFGCNPDGTLTSNDPGAGNLGELASPGSVEIRTGVFETSAPAAYGRKLFGTGTNQICRNDFAIVVLDRDLPLPISAMRLARGVNIGEITRIVGYGSTEMATSMGRYARTGLRVIDRGQDAGGSAAGTAAPRTVVVGQGPCHGDSGGPLFSVDTGALIGVYSLVSGASCTAVGVRNVYTRLEPFASLVQSAFDFAGAMPTLEPGDSTGDGGMAGESSSGVAGNTDVGGSGGTDSSSGGSGVAMSGTAGRDPRSGGSGSRQDASCACRAARARSRWPLESSALVFAVALVARRRRRGARRTQ